MITLQIKLKPTTKDQVYTELCNTMEQQKVFVGCGNCDEKWVIGQWEDEMDFLAWSVAMGLCKIIDEENPPTKVKE